MTELALESMTDINIWNIPGVFIKPDKVKQTRCLGITDEEINTLGPICIADENIVLPLVNKLNGFNALYDIGNIAFASSRDITLEESKIINKLYNRKFPQLR